MLKGTKESQSNQSVITQLVKAAKQDPRKFGDLYLIYVQPIFRYLYSRIQNVPEAEDVTAQTFLAALENFPKYHHDGYFSSWLFSIARNKAIDHFRKKLKQTSLDDVILFSDEPDLFHQIEKRERIEALSQLIRALPEDKQELIRLRYVAELSFAEIGHLLGEKEDTVKKSLYRLLAGIKNQMEVSND